MGSSGQKALQQQQQPGAQVPKAVPVTDLPTALTWEAVLTTNKHVHIVLAIGERIFLVNRSDQPQSLEAGTIIAGWFKGKFWQHRDAAGEPSKKKTKKSEEDGNTPGDLDVSFHLEDADSLVTHEGKLSKVLDLVTKQRVKQPDCKVAYHTLKDSPKPEQPGWFALDVKFHVYFRTENIPAKTADEAAGAPKVAMGHLAGCLPVKAWETALCHVVWAVKWNGDSEKGLTPLRPQVLTKTAVDLPPQKAIELTAASPAEAEAAAQT